MSYTDKSEQAKSSNRHYHRNKKEIIRKNGLRRIKTRQFIWELKRKPCKDCGNSFHPCAMDFDHIQGTKLKNIASMRSFSNKKILEEISKCELVCSNCHRLRTFNRLGSSV